MWDQVRILSSRSESGHRFGEPSTCLMLFYCLVLLILMTKMMMLVMMMPMIAVMVWKPAFDFQPLYFRGCCKQCKYKSLLSNSHYWYCYCYCYCCCYCYCYCHCDFKQCIYKCGEHLVENLWVAKVTITKTLPSVRLMAEGNSSSCTWWLKLKPQVVFYQKYSFPTFCVRVPFSNCQK